MSMHASLQAVLSPAYRCAEFGARCEGMRWEPKLGHVPRGFLGATGSLEEVELILGLTQSERS